MHDPRIVIALGGNALGDTPAQQIANVNSACPALVALIAQGYDIIITHGNGPQVGMINLAFDFASANLAQVPHLDLPECTAMSQGYIGYHLQQGIQRELHRQKMPWHVATVVTQIEVDPNDPAFGNPTKPIGSFYDERTAREMMVANPSLVMAEDSGRGWRQLVASPKPGAIIERESILNLLDHLFIVIASGGGGVPVVPDGEGGYVGVPAVIDKDLAAEHLAEAVDAEVLFILTAVDTIYLGFGTSRQREIRELDVDTAKYYLKAGEFGVGSMAPKVESAIAFVERKAGRRAIICSLEKAPQAMSGGAGTVIHS